MRLAAGVATVIAVGVAGVAAAQPQPPSSPAKSDETHLAILADGSVQTAA